MSEQIEPCGLCGREPKVGLSASSNPEARVVRCSYEACANGQRSAWLPFWNEAQAAIWAVRRKDFTAARMAFRTVEPFKEIPGELVDLGSEDAWVYEDFDDYIAGKAG